LVIKLFDCGIITCSKSPFSAPIIIVIKKVPSYKLYIDHKVLNKITIKDKLPNPFVDELLDKFHVAKYFYKLELEFDYYNIRIREEDKFENNISTYEGMYEFNIMLSKPTNTLNTFKLVMSDLFHPYFLL